MTDAGGTFRIMTSAKMIDGHPLEIDLGSIQSIADSFTTTISSQIGIPSQPAENTFVFDSGVTESYDISFTRPLPREIHDDYSHPSTDWSNGFWLYNMLKYVVNRWQAKTDGVRTYYIPDTNSRDLFNGWGYTLDDNGVPTANGVNCYVTSFIPRYRVGIPDAISGSISFIIGGLRLSSVLKSAIIFKANLGDDTNIVRQNDGSSVMTIACPTSWTLYASGIGKTFTGWNTASDGSGTPYPINDSVKLQGDNLTLYAIWS